MKLILKILAAPVVAALALFIWICAGLLYCSAFLFGLAGTIVAILGVAVLVTYSPQNGIYGMPFRTGYMDKATVRSVRETSRSYSFWKGGFTDGDHTAHAPAYRQGTDGGNGNRRHSGLCKEPAKNRQRQAHYRLAV